MAPRFQLESFNTGPIASARAIGLSLCLLWTAGCAPIPASQPFDREGSQIQIQQRDLAAASIRAAFERGGLPYPGTHGRWSLDALTVAAWQLRPELARMRALAVAANADVEAAGRRPNPSWSLTPEWISHAATGTSPWVTALLLSQLFEPPALRQARVDKAQTQADLVWQQQSQVAWEIRQQLATAAFEWQLEQLAVAQTNRTLALQQQLQAAIESAQQFGALPLRERLAAQEQGAQARIAHEEALQRAREAQAQLAAAIGVEVSLVAGLSLDLPDVETLAGQPALDESALRRAAATDRIDIASALADYASADSLWREQLSRRQPGLTLSPGYSYDSGQRRWVLGVGGELPINDDYGPAIAAASARRDAAGHQVEALQAQALAALSLAMQQLQEGRRALKQANALVQIQQQQVDSQQARAQAGAINRRELLLAQLQALQAGQRRIDVLRELVRAIGALEAAVQKPLWPASALARAPEVATEEPESRP